MITLQQILDSPNITFGDAILSAKNKGLFLEFGVAKGHTAELISTISNKPVYGFDSFEGIPEEWNGYSKGHFACEIPKVSENIILIPGLFQDTLPIFVNKHKKSKISFMHVDCDLYSSTKCIFDNTKNMIASGTIIAFDEIYNYGGETWLNHEFKAFNEFLEENNFMCECIGRYGQNQAAFKMKV
jgi:hypothetical protein